MSGESRFRERVHKLTRIARGELADMDAFLSKLLLWMVRASILTLLLGLALVAATGFTFPHLAVGYDRLVNEVLDLRAEAILDFGILLLLAVPLTRVVVSLGFFARRGDRTYALMTGIVLAILVSGLILGFAP